MPKVPAYEHILTGGNSRSAASAKEAVARRQETASGSGGRIAPVLTLGLRGDGPGVTDRALRLHAETGEPYRLTTRQLLREPPTLASAATVYVCENPTVVAAAANRIGTATAPLVCLEGQPRTAARLLLGLLAAAGVRLAYHGDFDWAGIHIGNLVVKRHGAVAWRFCSADYRAARGGRPLQGSPLAAAWDPELQAALVAGGRAVHEEDGGAAGGPRGRAGLVTVRQAHWLSLLSES